jgi:hypothetical protein
MGFSLSHCQSTCLSFVVGLQILFAVNAMITPHSITSTDFLLFKPASKDVTFGFGSIADPLRLAAEPVNLRFVRLGKLPI